LIKELEEQGIGRPSTYVPIISTIQDRGYVDQEQRRFTPTWLGETVNEVMNKHFPDIVDTSFTAEMERKLDDVEEGRQSWTEFLHGFYGDFKATMEKAEAEMNRVQKPVEEIDEVCPECGRNLVIRTGRFGRFISCSGFPECRYRRSFMNKTGALCPQSGGDQVERKTKLKKRVFYGCSNYPTCNFAIWERPVPDLCPSCGGLMVIPRGGQDPVCYTEVVALQHTSEEKPQQDGNTSLRPARKKMPPSTENVEAAPAEPKTTRRTSTTTRKKVAASTSADEPVTARSGKTPTRRSKTKKTSRRTSATKKTTAASRKSVASRAKTAKAK
jgi:DNA topoisomerase-1